MDKQNYESHLKDTGKLLVRKFKVDAHLNQVMAFFKQLDATITDGSYNIEDFEVIQ